MKNQTEIMERCGASSWYEVVNWVGSMTEEEILREVDCTWFGDESNAEFAEMLYNALN
jgi:hypothetical protein